MAKFDLDLYEKEQTRLANQKNAQLNAEVTLARALTDADVRKDVARLQASTVGKAQLNSFKNRAYDALTKDGMEPKEAVKLIEQKGSNIAALQELIATTLKKKGVSTTTSDAVIKELGSTIPGFEAG